MTQKEYEENLKAAAQHRRESDAYEIEQYNRAVQMARERLQNARAYSKLVQRRTIAALPPVERTNHYYHVKRDAHIFCRLVKKTIMAFVADDKEFEYENGQIAATVNEQFTITDEAVHFTISVEMKRKRHDM